MKIILFVFLLLADHVANAQKFAKIWETDTLMKQPESAIYDRANKMIYVSNVNGECCTKDGNGFISKVALDGTIQKLHWITGLNSPQGLAINDNYLYVADVDQVAIVDIRRGYIERKFKAKGAKFLNDITIDANGDVYVSDCLANKIFKLANNNIFVWLDNPQLLGPNGILCGNQTIMLLNMMEEKVYSIDKETKKFAEFCCGIKYCDGIVRDDKDGYFVSGALQGEIYQIDYDGQKSLVLNLGNEKVITADIDYIREKRLLVIPTLRKTVLAYRWK